VKQQGILCDGLEVGTRTRGARDQQAPLYDRVEGEKSLRELKIGRESLDAARLGEPRNGTVGLTHIETSNYLK